MSEYEKGYKQAILDAAEILRQDAEECAMQAGGRSWKPEDTGSWIIMEQVLMLSQHLGE